MNRSSLNRSSRAWPFRLGLPLGILLITMGGALVGPWMAAAQYPRKPLGNSVVPVPGATPQAARLRGQVPCEEIISRLDRNLRAEKGHAATVEDQRARAGTVATIAKRVGTTQLWVAQCMRAYGRRVPASLENVQNEDVVEQFEEQEPEESEPEDLTEPGARERNPLEDENSQDRSRLRADNPNNQPTPGKEKESVLRLRPQGTGAEETGFEGFEH